jgi:hypothetical protein
MKKLILLLAFLLILAIPVNLRAQTLPLVYDVENTGADCPVPYLPTINELPSIFSLPDPFEWADGRGRMKYFSDWRIRRAEISAQFQNYEIGQKPPRPDSITASYSGGTLTVNVYANGKSLTLSSAVSLPDSGDGPFPAIIGMNSPSGSIPANILTSRNIARITYTHNQVTTYSNQQNTDPYYQLYPDLNSNNTGQYSAWAWGVSRLIDGLALVQDVLPIDLQHIAVTGCSYAGKMALFAGAFDERIALTLAIESGGGGATSWRYSHSEPSGSVESLENTDHNWFRESMFQFGSDNVYLLPEDHHELMAMVAPRALYVTGNPDYTWLSNPSCDVCSRACQQVYEALGIADRFGFSIVAGHTHCQIPANQIPEIEAFIDKFMLGKDTVNTDNISDSPYSINLSPWITWTNPTLGSGTTFYTSLVYPLNLQAGLDTSITFKWKKINEAEKYYIQLSTDSRFANIIKDDSTTTDTSITFDGLLKNNKYFWRVRVKTALDSGPWSSISSFITTITLPAKPQIISAISEKKGYITLNWDKVEGAEQYLTQVANNQLFTSIFKSNTTSDTVKSVTWFAEDKTYYWRVQASNLAGTGPWSDVGDFTIVYNPTNLVAENTNSNEITLTWTDNSAIEEGYIIERKQGAQTTFAFLDTLKGGGDEYIDKNVEQGQTYIYRVKAFKGSLESSYSNEASNNTTGINEEEGIPKEYSLSQNYPNPFNPTTNIKFALPKPGLTKLIIYDLIGREIEVPINKELEAGYHQINIDATDLPTGVYFYRIQSGDFIQTKKMILIK